MEPVDVFLGVAYFLPEEKKKFSPDLLSKEVHEFFYTQSQEYPELFEDFSFYERCGHNHSDEIDYADYVMQFCGFLQSFGADYDPCEFTQKSNSRFEKKKLEFSLEDLKNLEKISEKFQNNFALEERINS